jgi:hypothetical protein
MASMAWISCCSACLYWLTSCARAEQAEKLPVGIVFRDQFVLNPAGIAVGPHPAALDPRWRPRLDRLAARREKRRDIIPVYERARFLDPQRPFRWMPTSSNICADQIVV